MIAGPVTTPGPSIVRHTVPVPLRELVIGIVGYDEVAPSAGRWRVQPAGSVLILEISLTTPLHICGEDPRASDTTPYDAFLAGFMLRPVRTVFFGRHTSVQIYFTPLGARRILRASGRATAGQVLRVSDVDPILARDLPDLLAEAPSWQRRFAVLDRHLMRLAGKASPIDPLSEWVWRELHALGGKARISEIVRRSGWSTRHVTNRFIEATGVSPKSAAQVIRFERVHAELETSSLGELAARHGYSDQSHLSREVRRFAGESPVALAHARRPTASTALGGGQLH